MGRSLNKILFFYFVFLCFGKIHSQEEESIKFQEKHFNERDYNKKQDFKKFHKHAGEVAAWQIQNLKFGALVVRLQNNQLKIDACIRIGDLERAKKVMAETQFYNKLMIRVYDSVFNFCKVYFIYAQSSDSLLKGKRKGLFIDSTLKVNDGMILSENFYLLAEKDYVYNSSIGFIKEDTAKYISETGPRTVEVPVVLKNKYGHQLKNPFPFYINRSFRKSTATYLVSETILFGNEQTPTTITFLTSKDNTLEKQSYYIIELNRRLIQFYEKNRGFQINDSAVKPFLY